MSKEYLKPRPTTDVLTEPYWAAAAEHRLVVQRCDSCGEHQFYPRPFCIHCGSDDVQWRDASGNGTLHTFSITYRNSAPGFVDDLPYVFAIVELEEGVRMTANVVDVPVDDITIGMPLRVTFTDIDEGLALPQFTSAS